MADEKLNTWPETAKNKEAALSLRILHFFGRFHRLDGGLHDF